MNLQNKLQVASLHVPPLMWKQFRSAMLAACQDKEEVIGFFFCQRFPISKKKIRYVPKAWVVPSSDCYEFQSDSGLVLKQSFHQYLLDTYLCDRSKQKKANTQLNTHSEFAPKSKSIVASDCTDYWLDEDCHLLFDDFDDFNEDNIISDRDRINSLPSSTIKLDVVHIHTHFGDEVPTFSYIDDRHEAEYAKFLAASYSHKPRLISGVFNESLSLSRFRIWDRQGIYHTQIEFSSDWFVPQTPSLSAAESELLFARQKVFGRGFQERLSGLKVALIGCGGIGAVFAEQLARLGVKHWILIDPDRLETVNLNRMPAANIDMVDQWWHKVHYVKWLIKRVYSVGSHVKTMPVSVEEEAVKEQIAKVDLIVVATDNHKSRQVAQELALKFTRPLMCLGTHIEIKPDLIPQMYCRVTVPPFGGNWCLMCGNVISLQQAALESAPNAIAQAPNQDGYIEGIDDPAVYWLNSICASTAVGIVQGIISGFIDADYGLDWIYDFQNSRWLKADPDSLTTADCYFCGTAE